MIEIIKQTPNKNEIICPSCGALLKYEDEDLIMYYNEQGFDCPNCNDFILVNSYPPFEFSTSFYHRSNDANQLSNEKTQELIDDCIKKLKENEDWEYNVCSTGDTIIFAYKDDECIECYVTKNFYEAVEFYDY